MRVSTMMRWTGLAGAMALLAACSDAPTAAPGFSAAAADVAFAKGGNGKGGQAAPVVNSGTFTVTPGQAVNVTFGNFSLHIDANALCASGSGYGRDAWNDDCELETKPVTFTATWSVADGAASIAFNKDVRFHPKKRAYLSVKAVGNWKNTDALLWFEGTGAKGSWVDEGSYDPQMKTLRAQGGTLLYRRLKHFSGYNVGVGANCDPMVESCGVNVGLDVSF